MRAFKLLTLLIPSVLLTGCTDLVIREFLNGPTPCNAKELKTVLMNNRNLNLVREGDSKDLLYSEFRMGEPHFSEYVRFDDGSYVEVAHYQSSSEICEMASRKEHPFEPVVMRDNVVVAVGIEEYQDLQGARTVYRPQVSFHHED